MQIVAPPQTDIVLCILWKRLGSPLPDRYRRDNGSTPTGTEFEFEDALKAARERGVPGVLNRLRWRRTGASASGNSASSRQRKSKVRGKPCRSAFRIHSA